MNAYLADRMAREHVDALLTEASGAYRARLARRSARARRARERANRRDGAANRVARDARTTPAVGHYVARPFAAVHAWFAAGQL
jgi:hypothetical protein